MSTQCDLLRIYGSEIEVKPRPEASKQGRFVGVTVANRGDVRVFGSSIRVGPTSAPPGSGRSKARPRKPSNPSPGHPKSQGGKIRLHATGVSVGEVPKARLQPRSGSGHGQFRMHAGAIRVDLPKGQESPGEALPMITGVRVHRHGGGSAQAAVLDTAFVFASKTGPEATVHRVLTDDPSESAIDAPFLWVSAVEPPSLAPASGRAPLEAYVEIDCHADGNCNAGKTPGPRPHLMIYNAACAERGAHTSPWFDTVTKRCRNEAE